MAPQTTPPGAASSEAAGPETALLNPSAGAAGEATGPRLVPVPPKPQVESPADSTTRPETIAQAAPPAPPMPAVPVPHREPPVSDAPGITKYVLVGEKLAAGSQPTEEGFAWLQKTGFRAVLDLREPGEWHKDEPTIVKDLGMKYLSLPVTPRTLSREKLEQFNEILARADLRPLFVHDSRGSRAGALWYLHAVGLGQVPEEEARRQAEAIGLKPDDPSTWLAVERVLHEMRKSATTPPPPTIPPTPKPSPSSSRTPGTGSARGTALRPPTLQSIGFRSGSAWDPEPDGRAADPSGSSSHPARAALGSGLAWLALSGVIATQRRRRASRRAAAP